MKNISTVNRWIYLSIYLYFIYTYIKNISIRPSQDSSVRVGSKIQFKNGKIQCSKQGADTYIYIYYHIIIYIYHLYTSYIHHLYIIYIYHLYITYILSISIYMGITFNHTFLYKKKNDLQTCSDDSVSSGLSGISLALIDCLR